MESALFGACLAALVGGCLAFVNYRLTAISAAKPGGTMLSLVPIVRMLLSVGYLVVLFLVGPATPWSPVWLLVGGAIGLTIPSFAFTFLLLRKLPGKAVSKDSEAENTHDSKGGDN